MLAFSGASFRTLLAGLVLLATVDVASSRPQICTPSGGPDLSVGCIKALTGCICTSQGLVAPGADPNCGGCWWLVSGSVDCNTGVSIPLSCALEVACGGSTTCGMICPCTQVRFFPFAFDCSPCPM